MLKFCIGCLCGRQAQAENLRQELELAPVPRQPWSDDLEVITIVPSVPHGGSQMQVDIADLAPGTQPDSAPPAYESPPSYFQSLYLKFVQ